MTHRKTSVLKLSKIDFRISTRSRRHPNNRYGHRSPRLDHALGVEITSEGFCVKKIEQSQQTMKFSYFSFQGTQTSLVYEIIGISTKETEELLCNIFKDDLFADDGSGQVK